MRAPGRQLLFTILLTLTPLAGCEDGPVPEPSQDPAPGQKVTEPRGDPSTDSGSAPGPLRAVDGLSAFQSRSRLTYAQPGVKSYQLEATYAFPERARWRMEPERARGDRSTRRMHFQFGSELWLVREGKNASIAFLGEEKRLTALQLELRRVAMTWPAELEWTGEGKQRRAELPDLGILVAEIDPDTERPVAIESRLSEEEVYERLEGIEWQEIEKRPWPASWTLLNRGTPIWRETFLQIIPGGRFLESYFQPPDRREPGDGHFSAQPQRVELPPRVVHARALEVDSTWDQALAAAGQELAIWKKRLDGQGLRLDERPVFRLSPRGLPIAVELRLEEPLQELPEGWIRLEGGDGLSVLQEGLAGLEGNALPTLRREVPEGSQAGTPYALVGREEGGEGGIGLVQVVLPLVGGE